MSAHLKASLPTVLSTETLQTINLKKVLLIGAGGVGCEVLKNLVASGFRLITVIDMDTIELSNLNRQFLFTRADIGKYKTEVACRAVLDMYPCFREDCVITPLIVNVLDLKCDFFQNHDIIISALDNLEARQHVNKCAVMVNRPVIESGTAGFQGQVGVWTPGKECYDCRHHSPPVVFPVCTIRAFPTKMIHCVVWAKEYLMPVLFGSCDTMGDENNNDVEDIEEEEIKEQLKDQGRILKELIRNSAGQSDLPKAVLKALYVDDIERVLSMKEAWEDANDDDSDEQGSEGTSKKIKPEPLDLESNSNVDPPNYTQLDRMQQWSLRDWISCFLQSFNELQERTTPPQFDKDDDVIMAFTAAAANLRAHCYQIAPSISLFDCKQMAGNIIPAVATTNAIAAGLACLQAIQLCRIINDGSQNRLSNVYITHGSTSRLLTRENLALGEDGCQVCDTVRVICRFEEGLTLRILLSKSKIDVYEDLCVMLREKLLFDAYDMDASRLDLPITSIGIQPGDIFTILSDQLIKPVLVTCLKDIVEDCVIFNEQFLHVKPSKKRRVEADSESDNDTKAKEICLDDDFEIVSS